MSTSTQPLALPPLSAGELPAITGVDSRLAVELALQITPVPDLLKRYEITAAQLKSKLKDPLFRAQIKQAKAVWQSDLNIKERIRMKAGFLVEDSLLAMFGMVHNEGVQPAVRNDAFKSLARVAAVDAPETKGAGTEGLRVVINFPQSPSLGRPLVTLAPLDSLV